MALAALARLVAPELARGLSTTLAIFSSSPKFPDCVCAPVINFPEIRPCPDCICQGDKRTCPLCPAPQTTDLSFLLLVWVLGLLTGIAITRYFCCNPLAAAAPGVDQDRAIGEVPAGTIIVKPSAAAIAAAKRLASQK